MTEPAEYLPRPDGYEARVAELTAAGDTPADAHWKAASEALGAVARRESNDSALFWHGETPDEQRSAERDAWDRVAEREGQRFYFHQRKDTLVGYLAHGRHEARVNTQTGARRQERLVAFIKDRGLWDAWVGHNRSRLGLDPQHGDQDIVPGT